MNFKIPDTITEEELIKILKATKKDKYKVAFMLGFYQSLRIREVLKLNPEDILFNEHLIKIKKSKGHKDRNIPIIKPILLNPQSIIRALKKLPLDIKRRSLQHNIKQIGLKVLNKDIHFHILRHSGATWLINKKHWSTRQVQQFLGHTKVSTTEIYTHVTPQDLINLEWD